MQLAFETAHRVEFLQLHRATTTSERMSAIRRVISLVLCYRCLTHVSMSPRICPSCACGVFVSSFRSRLARFLTSVVSARRIAWARQALDEPPNLERCSHALRRDHSCDVKAEETRVEAKF